LLESQVIASLIPLRQSLKVGRDGSRIAGFFVFGSYLRRRRLYESAAFDTMERESSRADGGMLVASTNGRRGAEATAVLFS
jgi:hypothetical protein